MNMLSIRKTLPSWINTTKTTIQPFPDPLQLQTRNKHLTCDLSEKKMCSVQDPLKSNHLARVCSYGTKRCHALHQLSNIAGFYVSLHQRASYQLITHPNPDTIWQWVVHTRSFLHLHGVSAQDGVHVLHSTSAPEGIVLTSSNHLLTRRFRWLWYLHPSKLKLKTHRHTFSAHPDSDPEPAPAFMSSPILTNGLLQSTLLT